MIGRRRQVVVVVSLASVVDKSKDHAFRLPPYGYESVYVVNVLIAA